MLEMSDWAAGWWKLKVLVLWSTEHSLPGVGATVQNELYHTGKELIFSAGQVGREVAT